jgi:hypothetical protein
VVVAGAGYQGNRRYYQRLGDLGARLVIVDEPRALAGVAR